MAKQKPTKTKEAATTGTTGNMALPAERLYAIVIFAFSFILYFNAVFNGYNMDDELVTQNHRLTSKGIGAISEIFASPYYQDESGYKYEYRPMVLVSFAIEHGLFGEHAWLSHLINVLLYSLLCVLLFKVLQKLLKEYSVVFPFIITLLFAAHPIHTEVVSSIKNRDEIMAAGFALLSLYFAWRCVYSKNKLLLIPVVLFFVAGVLSKTTSITFAVIIPLLLVLFTEVTLGGLLAVSVALAIPAVLFSRLNSAAQQLILGVALNGIALFFYVLKYWASTFSAVKNFFSVSVNSAAPSADTTVVFGEPDFSFYKSKATILPVVAIVMCTLLSLSGYWYGYWWLTVIPFAVLSALFVFSRNEVKLLLLLPLTLLVVVSLPLFPNSMIATEAPLIILLAVIALVGGRAFRTTALAAFAIYAVSCVLLKHSSFFIAGLGFVFFLDKRLRPVLIAFFSVYLLFYVYSLYGMATSGKAFTLKPLAFPIIFAGVYMVWQQKQALAAKAAAILLPVITLLYFFLLPPQTRNLAYDVRESYNTIDNLKAADPTPVQAVRPLVYMEAPVTAKDPLSIRLGTSLVILSKYAKLICVPYLLSFYYGYAVVTPTALSQPLPIISLLLHLALLVVALVALRKYPVPAAGILIYLVAIVVFGNLVTPIPGLMGDRFLFIPSIGFCMVAAWGLAQLLKQLPDMPVDVKQLSKPFTYALVTVLVLYSGLTIARNRNWKDQITLFRHDMPAVEQSAQAHNLLALHLFIASNNETDRNKQTALRNEAATHFERAITIYPKFLNASFDYARLLEAMGRYEDALKAYQHSSTIDSNFTAPYFSMAILYQKINRFDQAIVYYQKYLNTHPGQEVAYANLSFAYYKMGQFEKSIEVSRQSIAANPANAFNPTVNIAKTYLKMQANDSALYYFELAQKLNPADPNTATFIEQLKSKKQ